MAPWIGRFLKNKQIIAVLLFLPLCWANAFSVSVSGATTWEQDSKEPSKINVIAGYAIPSLCASRDNATPCNSCTGQNIDIGNSQTIPAPCNENSIYEDLTFTVQVDSDKADINELDVGIAKAIDYSSNKISGITFAKVNGRTYSLSASWAQVMTALGVASLTACTTTCGGTKTFYLGPIKEDKFVEYVAINLTYSIVNYGSSSTLLNAKTKGLAPGCHPTTTDPLTTTTQSEGLCYYEMFPGDGKAYITNLIAGWGGSTPTDADTTLNYSNLVMFYTEKTTGTEFETLKTITNASSKSFIGLSTSDSDPLSEYKVGNLENGSDGVEKTYCFMSAMQDVTGNIFLLLGFAGNCVHHIGRR